MKRSTKFWLLYEIASTAYLVKWITKSLMKVDK